MPTTKEPTPASISQLRVATARATLRERLAEQEQARNELRELKARLSMGDDTVSADALMLATLNVERSDTLAKAAQRELTAAERSQITDHPDIAEALAGALQDGLDGVPVQVTATKPDKPSRGLPTLWLVQTKPSVSNPSDGFVSGAVTLLYERNRFMVPLTEDRVDEILKGLRASIDVRPASTSELGGNLVDRIELDVRTVAPLTMTIAGPTEAWRVGQLRQQIEHLVKRAVESPFLHERGGTAARAEVKVASDRTDSAGLRTRRVEVEASSWATRPDRGRDREDAARSIAHHVAGLVGEPVPGLGRIATVSEPQVSALSGWRAIKATFAVELVSQVAR